VSEFPERIEVESAGRRGTYSLRTDLYAVHDWDGSSAESPVLALPETRVAVFSGSPAGRMPVYAMEPGGGLFVPTGTVWVRFAEGVDAASRAPDLEKIGFRIERSPKYAPNAAFVAAAEPAAALSGLSALRALEGVEHVELQMLSAASSR
jgi:hypothetical protein